MSYHVGDRVASTLNWLRGTVKKVQPSWDGKKVVVIVTWDSGIEETVPPKLQRELRVISIVDLLGELA